MRLSDDEIRTAMRGAARPGPDKALSSSPTERAYSAKRRYALTSGGLCINGASHGPRTHGCRCKHCHEVHRGKCPEDTTPIARDDAAVGIDTEMIAEYADALRDRRHGAQGDPATRRDSWHETPAGRALSSGDA